jgi:hypothetical protein
VTAERQSPGGRQRLSSSLRDLAGTGPDFYIAPVDWVRQDVEAHYAKWLESKGWIRPRNPDSDHTCVDLDRIRQWHQRWEILAAALAGR